MRLQTPNDKGFISKVYDRFFELPVALVLAVIWLVGAALLGLCILVLYMLWSLLKVLMAA